MQYDLSHPNQWYYNHDMVNLVLFNGSESLDFFCNVKDISFKTLSGKGIRGHIPAGSLCAINWRGMKLYFCEYKGGNPVFKKALRLDTFEFIDVNASYKVNTSNASFMHAEHAILDTSNLKFYGGGLQTTCFVPGVSYNIMTNMNFIGSQLEYVYRTITNVILTLGNWVLNHRINDLGDINKGVQQYFASDANIVNHKLSLSDNIIDDYQQFLNYCQEEFAKGANVEVFV